MGYFAKTIPVEGKGDTRVAICREKSAIWGQLLELGELLGELGSTPDI